MLEVLCDLLCTWFIWLTCYHYVVFILLCLVYPLQQSSILAVRVRLKKVITFLKAAHVPEPCGIRYCLDPPSARRKTMVLCKANLVCAIVESCVVGMGRLAPLLLRHKTMVLCRKRGATCLPPPKTQSHSFVCQTKPWTQVHNLLWHLSWISTRALRQPLRIEQT